MAPRGVSWRTGHSMFYFAAKLVTNLEFVTTVEVFTNIVVPFDVIGVNAVDLFATTALTKMRHCTLLSLANEHRNVLPTEREHAPLVTRPILLLHNPSRRT